MAIDFPDSPDENEDFTVDGKTWTFSDGKWALNVGVGGVQGPTGPSGPSGASGASGTPGTAGADGASGTPGTNGAVGATGPGFNAIGASTSVTVNVTTALDSFSAATYRSAEYLVQVTQGSKYTVSKVLLIHNGTTPTMTEYGVVEVGSSRIPMTLSTDIDSGTVYFEVTITDAASTNATVKLTKLYMVV
jgi:hypothetical protein